MLYHIENLVSLVLKMAFAQLPEIECISLDEAIKFYIYVLRLDLFFAG